MCETVDDSPRYIIDISTPETLERDFYAWLKGENIHDKSSDIKMDYECTSPKLPSISHLGEFIGQTNDYSSYSQLSSVDNQYQNINQLNYHYLPYHYNNNNNSNTNYYDEQIFSDNESNSPAPSSNSSSISSSISSNSPINSIINCNNNNNNSENNNPQQQQQHKQNVFEIDDKVEQVTGRTKSRFSNTINGRSSGTNQLGRTYSPGLPLSMSDREQIVSLYQNGWKICDISKKLCVTHSCVSKILNRFRLTGSVRPKDAKESRVESPLVAAIRDYRYRLGMTRQSEIREQLILDGICRRDNVPSRSSINHILRTKLDIKRPQKKKLEENININNNDQPIQLQQIN